MPQRSIVLPLSYSTLYCLLHFSCNATGKHAVRRQRTVAGALKTETAGAGVAASTSGRQPQGAPAGPFFLLGTALLWGTYGPSVR